MGLVDAPISDSLRFLGRGRGIAGGIGRIVPAVSSNPSFPSIYRALRGVRAPGSLIRSPRRQKLLGSLLRGGDSGPDSRTESQGKRSVRVDCVDVRSGGVDFPPSRHTPAQGGARDHGAGLSVTGFVDGLVVRAET